VGGIGGYQVMLFWAASLLSMYGDQMNICFVYLTNTYL
jgi:hypothetical protein